MCASHGGIVCKCTVSALAADGGAGGTLALNVQAGTGSRYIVVLTTTTRLAQAKYYSD